MTIKKIKPKRKLNTINILAIIVSVIAVIMIIGGIGGIIIANSMLASKPTINISDFESSQSTQIYDEDDNLIAEIGQTIRTNISYDEIPTSLVDAFVSVEDSRFFAHNGFDISRFSKAILANIVSGSFSQGGSTFTMQLVKNTYFTDDSTNTTPADTVERKVQEIALSIALEPLTNKEKIFEYYVNKINFGGTGNIRGVEKASEYYFNKQVSDLNLAESAMLAGIVNSPNAYNPFNNLEQATERRDTVLYQMYNHGYITKTEYQLAKSIKVEDLLVDPNSKESEENPYQAYIDTAVRETIELTGKDPYVTSMKIYTSMNKIVQQQMDDIQDGNVDDFTYPDDKVEIAGVSLNNHTGEINGIMGGRNYAKGGELLLNHATQQYRQPGSSVKPYLEYALAFENLGWATDQVLVDKPITYRGTDFIIHNSNGTYAGEVTLKDAIGWSLNTPAVQTLQEVIDNKSSSYVVDYLNKLGFSQVTTDNFDTGYAIGGSTFEITCVQSAAAQAMLLNQGNYIQPHTVRKIEFNDGSDPIEPSYIPVNVLSTESAYLADVLLKSNIDGPYFSSVDVLKTSYPIYVKTGTSNWGSEAAKFGIPVGNTKDVWMIGSTADYTVNCWYGYDKAIKDEDTYFNSTRLSGNVRGYTVNYILDANGEAYGTPSTLEQPAGVTSITHILGVFPYVSPIEGMDSAYITTGLINKKFANLTDPEEYPIDNIDENGFVANLDSKGKLSITFPTYPDASKLEVASQDLDISLYDSNNNLIQEAWGKRLFDYSWVFGPIRYKVHIENGDTVIDENIDSATKDYQLQLEPGTTITVKGSYTFEKYPIESNVVTKTFEIKDNDVSFSVPSSVVSTQVSTIKEELNTWAAVYNITLDFTTTTTHDTTKNNTIEIYDKNNNLLNGTTITKKQSELMTTTYSVIIYQYEACPDNYTSDGAGGCKLISGSDTTNTDNNSDATLPNTNN